MTTPENIKDLLNNQKELQSQLNNEIEDLLNSDLLTENESLKNQYNALKEKSEKLENSIKELSEQNSELKNTLFEQIYSEKVTLLNNSKQKSSIYFKSKISGETDRLVQLQKALQDKTDRLAKELESERTELSSQIRERLKDLSTEVSKAVSDAKALAAKEEGAFSAESQKLFEELKNEEITEETMSQLRKKNNLESFVGGNILNMLGVLFMILGFIALSRFTFIRLPDIFKGIILFFFSGCFLIASEILNRKKRTVFSLGLTSIGVAGFYISLSVSYFILGIIGSYVAITLCILITIGSIVLSERYNSQTVACFALIGGYLPLMSIAQDDILFYGAMVYFAILNLLALSFSFVKKWSFATVIGYILNVFATFFLIMFLPANTTNYLNEALIIVYTLFVFAVHTAIPIIGNIRTKQCFKKLDITIISINTIISALTIYFLFYIFDFEAYTGLLAVIFAVIYICLGKFLERIMSIENKTIKLFYITGLTFVILIIPLQFGVAWLSIGWLIQGLILSLYGILKDEKDFKQAGKIIAILCFAAFFYYDIIFSRFTYIGTSTFPYKYTAISLGSVLILAALAYKKELYDNFDKLFKYFVVINTWLYPLYLISLLRSSLYGTSAEESYNIYFLTKTMSIVFTLIFANVLPYIPVIVDKTIKRIALIISIIGTIWLMLHLSLGVLIPPSNVPLSISVISGIILAAVSLLSVFTMKNIILYFILEKKWSVELLPLGVSLYFLVILSQTLIFQYDLEVTSAIISIIYVVAALAWIIHGFIKRYHYMRRFGLILSILAVAKLFLVDLPFLNQESRIVSYFAFGISFLGISFIYQYFSKKLIKKEGSDAK